MTEKDIVKFNEWCVAHGHAVPAQYNEVMQDNTWYFYKALKDAWEAGQLHGLRIGVLSPRKEPL